MYEDAPEDLCAERLAMAVYKGRPLGRPILGKASTLEQMTGESLRRWQQEHYVPGAIVAALAGSFEERHVDAPRPAAVRPARGPPCPRCGRPSTSPPSPCGRRPSSRTT